MGYLHDGHLSLVDRCREENDVTIVSIFVNPTQFGPGEDFDSYPRDLGRDRRLLQERGVDIVFYPSREELYPQDYLTYVEVEQLGGVLCGAARPGHFRGVTTIVSKLLNIVAPSRAYFGRKDAQQAIIIKRMVRDLNMDTDIRTLPIVRDEDGLALSSRNSYLSSEERKAALCLQAALRQAEAAIRSGLLESAALKELIVGKIREHPLVTVDYVEMVSLDRLETLDTVEPGNTLVAAAVRVGKARLIDNFILGDI
jgi:pantoate--beta-alanine ligase